jgi:hypothetical protein
LPCSLQKATPVVSRAPIVRSRCDLLPGSPLRSVRKPGIAQANNSVPIATQYRSTMQAPCPNQRNAPAAATGQVLQPPRPSISCLCGWMRLPLHHAPFTRPCAEHASCSSCACSGGQPGTRVNSRHVLYLFPSAVRSSGLEFQAKTE